MKYKCITPWARNKKGDIIEHWELKRYPPEVHSHFEKIEDAEPSASSNKQSAPAPKVSAKQEPPKESLDTDISTIIKKPKIQFGDEN